MLRSSTVSQSLANVHLFTVVRTIFDLWYQNAKDWQTTHTAVADSFKLYIDAQLNWYFQCVKLHEEPRYGPKQLRGKITG